MKDAPLAPVAILFAVLLSLYLTYRFIYLKRIRYHVGSEQLTAEQGVFQRSIGYIPKQNHIVNIIRERVEYNKQRKGIYEITNH